MNNPFEYIPDGECREAFRKLTEKLELLKSSDRAEDVSVYREFEAGKMLGVLIACDSSGSHHTLYAFSGQLGDSGFHYPGFVGPVFDYLQTGGYFKTREREISRQTAEISLFERGELERIRHEYNLAEKRLSRSVTEYRDKCQSSKAERDEKRKSGVINEAEKAAMIRQSQFEKAELRRLKKKMACELEPFAEKLRSSLSQLEAMKEKRRSDSDSLQKWLFSNFRLMNARGETRSLSEIFADTPMKIPPSGAGECCAPKLLHAAYIKGWQPVAIAEYWYGKSKEGEVRIHGMHYPACRGKCLPVLSWMLRGLEIHPPLESGLNPAAEYEPEIIYENEWFCVVNKPGGMLSVPGKGKDLSVQQWLEEKYGADRHVKMAHRLDQDTSGLLIATFGSLAFKTMQALFATRKVKKTYLAELEGNYQSHDIPSKGRIVLPLSADWLDRPRQRVDSVEGKEAVTDYEFLEVKEGRSRILFHPLTGRTHQLRVHAASGAGLGLPIAGDRLYGKHKFMEAGRLFLHALSIEFTFPLDSRHYIFETPASF